MTDAVASHASRTTGDDGDVVLRLRGVSKHFGAITALDGVSLDIRRGEVVALVGDNGAGKSTLAKVVAGVHSPDDGSLELEGRTVSFANPGDARKEGIETVYQDLALVEELDVAGNFFLGREETHRDPIRRLFGVLRLGSMREKAEEAISRLRVTIPDISQPVARMSGGQRQGVAIGRTLFWGRRLMILDEPTAALGVDQSEQVLKLLEGLKEDPTQPVPMVIISHNMQDVYRIADRVVVLRHGRKVADLDRDQTSPQEIVGYITGALPKQDGDPAT